MNRRVLYGRLGGQAKLNAYIRSLSPALWLRNGMGTAAAQWDDISGNGRHVTLSGSPTLNADGSYTFNGVNQYGTAGAFTLVQPTAVFFVVTQVSWTSGDVLFDGAGVAGGACQQTTSTPRISISAGSSACEISTVAVGTKAVVCAVFNGASSRLVRNLDVATAGNAGTNNMGGFTLAAIGGGAAAWSNIRAYEAVILPIAPSTAQRERIVAGLMARHGVA